MEEINLFKLYNNNPNNKITSDCIVRSVSSFLDQKYSKTLQDLIQIYTKTGYHIGDPVCFMLYLKNLNKFQKIVLSKDKSLLLKDMCKYIQAKDYTNLLNINSKNCDNVLVLLKGNHLTFLQNGVIMDVGNCCNLYVNTYWVYKENNFENLSGY